MNRSSDMLPLHVCIVAPTASSILPGSEAEKAGGAELQLRHIGRGFARRGARVSFVVDGIGQHATVDVDGMEIIMCPFRYFGLSRLYFPGDTVRLLSLIRLLTPDVVLFKTPRTLAFSLSLVKAGSATKVVRIMASDSDCDRQFVPVTNTLYLLGARRMDGTIFQSNAQAALARRRLGLRGCVIPNISHGGLPSNATAAACREETHEKDIDCLWVGTCNANKSPLEFLEVARAFPEWRFSMIMAPDSDMTLQQAVISQAAALANMDYRGFVPYDQIGGFFQRARLLVHTSLREGFPNVFLQAWECGVPVVARNIDPDNVIVRYGLGRVSGCTEQVINDVGELLTDETQRAAIGDACRDYLLHTHSQDVVIDQYLDYFREIGVTATTAALGKAGDA